jgi:hypothetical protein
MLFSLDTMVVVAAILGVSDLFYEKWLTFAEGCTNIPLVVMRSVRQEYESTAEGIGRDDGEPGRIERIIGDLYRGVALLRTISLEDEDRERKVSELRLAQQAEGLILEVLSEEDDPSMASERVRGMADAFEQQTARNRISFFTRVSVVGPQDLPRVEDISTRLQGLAPRRGRSWENDTLHVAQTYVYSIEEDEQSSFVTEDRRHFDPKVVADIFELLGRDVVIDICDLTRLSLSSN